MDASTAAPIEDSNGYDFLLNTVGHPGERRDIRALNVNTVDEVPDSSWFTNRIGRKPLSVPEIVRGPDLWAAFLNRTDLIPSGDVHPNDAGQVELRKQWATTIAAIP